MLRCFEIRRPAIVDPPPDDVYTLEFVDPYPTSTTASPRLFLRLMKNGERVPGTVLIEARIRNGKFKLTAATGVTAEARKLFANEFTQDGAIILEES